MESNKINWPQMDVEKGQINFVDNDGKIIGYMGLDVFGKGQHGLKMLSDEEILIVNSEDK